MKYTEARQKFIQSWGVLGSSWGVSRTMAQIHALLLVASRPLSTEEIMEDLQISRGNANMNIRALIDWGLASKEIIAGERKEFFVADKDVWNVAQQIAKERKKRELEPILKVLGQVSDLEGESKEIEEFKKVTGDIKNFAGQAESALDIFIKSGSNWLLKIIGKVRRSK
ncbi:MAG: transcriptional regulator [Bacteroidota bacterium]